MRLLRHEFCSKIDMMQSKEILPSYTYHLSIVYLKRGYQDLKVFLSFHNNGYIIKLIFDNILVQYFQLPEKLNFRSLLILRILSILWMADVVSILVFRWKNWLQFGIKSEFYFEKKNQFRQIIRIVIYAILHQGLDVLNCHSSYYTREVHKNIRTSTYLNLWNVCNTICII